MSQSLLAPSCPPSPSPCTMPCRGCRLWQRSRRWLTWRRLGTLLVLGLFVLYALAWWGRATERMIMQGAITHNRFSTRIVGVRPTRISTSVGPVEVFITRPQLSAGEPEDFWLVFPGSGDHAGWSLPRVLDHHTGQRSEIWFVHYPGTGRSGGKATFAEAQQAALELFDHLQQKAGSRPVFVEGNSLGCTFALFTAARRPAAGLLLRNPPLLRQVTYRQAWPPLRPLLGPLVEQVPEDLDAVANARRVHVPAVFLESANDETVPVDLQERVIAAYAGPKTRIVLAGAGHDAPVAGPALAQIQKAVVMLRHSTVAAARPTAPGMPECSHRR